MIQFPEHLQHVHIVGIGGSGVSALARLLAARGVRVTGSDEAESDSVASLRQEGIVITTPHTADVITSTVEVVIYSVAVSESIPERVRAHELAIPQLSYPEALGAILRSYRAVGVSGTNGKTTTTAMLALILIEAGLDPTVVVGSVVPQFGSNVRLGQSEYCVFESDEYRRAFDHYQPEIAAVTYIGEDHLDIYPDQAAIIAAFRGYLSRVTGTVVYNFDDSASRQAVAALAVSLVSYGLTADADVQARDIRIADGRQYFQLWEGEQAVADVSLGVPGRYNIYNALAAATVARQIGVSGAVIARALASFTGTWRRFERVGQYAGAEVIIDYAHTPDAVAATIAAAQEMYPGRRLLAVFQPHQYHRTKALFEQFSRCFDQAPETLLSDIYYVVGREDPATFDVSSERLAQAAVEHGARVTSTGDLMATAAAVRQRAGTFDILLIMGAGTIYTLPRLLADT